MKNLFKVSGFLPYILIIFLNAMTDLGHKIILQNTIFKAYSGSELIILTALVNALILLPFIFLFSPSGYLSDKYSKTKIIKVASAVAIGITALITLSYYLGLFWVAFALTFVLAAQSAIYSPAKYGLIKEMLGSKNIASGNGLVQAVTIVSILLGALFYSILFEKLLQNSATTPQAILEHIAPLGFLLVIASTIEFALASKLEKIVPKTTTKKGKFKTKFYFNFTYLKVNLRKSKNFIEIGTIPLGALGIALTLAFIPVTSNLTILAGLILAFGFFAGIIMVPLNSLIQFFTPKEELGTVLAGNNFMQNIFMFLFLILTALFGYINLSSTLLFYLVAIVAFAE